MPLLKPIIYFSFLFAIMSCTIREKKQNVWIENLCCMDDSTKFVLDDLGVTSSNFLEIELCYILKKEIRIVLIKKANRGKDSVLFDVLSKAALYGKNYIFLDTTLGKYFKGEMNSFTMDDGQYYLTLGYGQTCGSISFRLKNDKIREEKLHCIKKCS